MLHCSYEQLHGEKYKTLCISNKHLNHLNGEGGWGTLRLVNKTSQTSPTTPPTKAVYRDWVPPPKNKVVLCRAMQRQGSAGPYRPQECRLILYNMEFEHEIQNLQVVMASLVLSRSFQHRPVSVCHYSFYPCIQQQGSSLKYNRDEAKALQKLFFYD